MDAYADVDRNKIIFWWKSNLSLSVEACMYRTAVWKNNNTTRREIAGQITESTDLVKL